MSNTNPLNRRVVILDTQTGDVETVPLKTRLWAWTVRSLPRSRAFWVALPAVFMLMAFIGYMEGVGLWPHPYIGGWMLNPLTWWPYYLTGNHFVHPCELLSGLHNWLILHPFEYALSMLWWLLVSVAVARVISRAWSRRAQFRPWIKANAGILATFVALLWIITLLAHLRDTGYTHGYCDIYCSQVAGISLVSLSWVFWWPFHMVGLGCFCGRGPLDYPFLYLASFLWWLLLSWILARLTLPGLREFREKPPFRLRRRRRLPPRQKESS